MINQNPLKSALNLLLSSQASLKINKNLRRLFTYYAKIDRPLYAEPAKTTYRLPIQALMRVRSLSRHALSPHLLQTLPRSHKLTLVKCRLGSKHSLFEISTYN